MDLIVQLAGWLAENYIELIGTVMGIIYLFLSVKGNIWLWFFGFCTSLLYVLVFFENKLYADMGINVYYVAISIYGWINWKFVGNDDSKELKIRRFNAYQLVVSIAVTAVFFIVIAFVLVRFTDADLAIPDAFTTAASIVATWMLARKIIQHWIYWIIIDAASLIIYIYKGLYPTAALFTVYTVMAVLGYFHWKKLEHNFDKGVV